MAALVHRSGSEAGRWQSLDAKRLVFTLGDGSRKGTDISIIGRDVDPTHSMLEWVDGELWLQSVAGPTWVDHVELPAGSRVRLHFGERLTVGEVSLQLCEDSEAEALSAHALEARAGRGTLDPLTLLLRPKPFWAGLAAVAEEGARVSVALIDMDRWAWNNDIYGMQVGDQMLQWGALQLEKQALPQEVLARVGGTRFALRMRELGPWAACERAVAMLEALSVRPYRLGGKPLTITASAGCATLGLDGDTTEALVRCAEARLDQAKATGRARAVGRADSQRFDKPPGAS